VIQEGKLYEISATHEEASFNVYDVDGKHVTRAYQVYLQANGEIALSTGNRRIVGWLKPRPRSSQLWEVRVEEVRNLQQGEIRKGVPINSMPDSEGCWAVTYELDFFGLANTAASCEILVELLEEDPFVVSAGSNGHLVVDHIGDLEEVSHPKDFFKSIEETLRWRLAEMSETVCTHGNNCYECAVDSCELPAMAVLIGSYAEMT